MFKEDYLYFPDKKTELNDLPQIRSLCPIPIISCSLRKLREVVKLSH